MSPATSARPRRPKSPSRYQRLAVIGANADGLEPGQMFGNFGGPRHFIDLVRIAPFAEPGISEIMRTILQSDGHTVLEGAAPARPTSETRPIESSSP